MNAQPQEIAVIRARLPYVDSRALSEAWYSALHLASNAAVPALARRPPPATPLAQFQAELKPPARTGRRAVAAPPGRAREKPQQGSTGAVPDTLRARDNPIRRRTVPPGGPATLPVHITFTTTVANVRVRIAARQDGGRLHVVAVCSAQHVATVRRALALATIALRMHGTTLESTSRVGASI